MRSSDDEGQCANRDAQQRHEPERPTASLRSLLGSRRVQYASVCNAHQIVAFLASRTDGIAPLKGKALVLNGETSLVTNFGVLWQNLSPGAIAERRLTYLLSSAVTAGIPRKLSAFLTEYPRFRYRSRLQEDLRTVADLLLEDLPTTSSVEKKFLEQCYCESGALSNYAMASKEIISARYSACCLCAGHARRVMRTEDRLPSQPSLYRTD